MYQMNMTLEVVLFGPTCYYAMFGLLIIVNMYVHHLGFYNGEGC